MPLIQSVLQPIVRSAVQRVDGVIASTGTIMDDAFALYGLYDWLGTGNNIVRFYNPNSSPQERDFTEAELTDGTYASWHVSGTTDIYKFYDQKGVSDHDMVSGANSITNAAHYSSVTNEAMFTAVAFMQYSYYQTAVSSAITSAFQDQQVPSANTMVMSMRRPSGNIYDLPVSGRGLIGMRDGVTPYGITGADHRILKIKPQQYSTAIQLSYRATNNTTQLSTNTASLGYTTLNTFTGGINVTGGVNDNFDIFTDGSHTVDEDYDISAFTRIAKLQLGDNRFNTQGAVFFNKELTQDEHDEVHTIMSANY
jgi:hypothetical protein